LFSISTDVILDEVVGWPSPSQPAQNGTNLPEPLACQLNSEFANAFMSTVCALDGSLADGSDVG